MPKITVSDVTVTYRNKKSDEVTALDGKCVLQGEPMQVYNSGNAVVESLKGGAILS